MAKTRKIEKRTLPSGLISYRAPYIDASGKRRSKNFECKSDADFFLLTVGNELVHGTHTPASVSPELWPKPPNSGSRAANGKGSNPRQLTTTGSTSTLHILAVHRRDETVRADHTARRMPSLTTSRSRPVGGLDPARGGFTQQHLHGSQCRGFANECRPAGINKRKADTRQPPSGRSRAKPNCGR